MINLEHPHIELFEVEQLNTSILDNCEISLESATESDIVFYNNKNDAKSLELLKERLSNSSVGLLVLAHRPKMKINRPYAVAQEGKFLDAQKHFLNQLFPINKNPKIIAITGTNGKTTSTFLAQQLLNQVGVKAVAIGTTGVWGDQKYSFQFKTTTPSYIDLWKIFSSLQDEVSFFFLEASSHALEQNRFGNFNFISAAWTNLTRDHLDYHQDMKSYFNAKKKILDFLIPEGRLILPSSQSSLREQLSSVPNLDIVEFSEAEKELISEVPFFKLQYNQENLLLAYKLAKSVCEDVNLDKVGSLKAPPGRFDLISKRENSYVVVDYAHTPDAVENVIASAREAFPGFAIKVIFGCGGSRDRQKRSMMGEIVSGLSDEFIITNDNPRKEKPEAILQDIVSGILPAVKYNVELDRAKAIEIGVKNLSTKEILLILGKGHETEQIFEDKTIYFSDHDEVMNNLKE